MYKDLVDTKGEYYTPLFLFNYINKYFNFELDPCDDGNKWLGLPYHYTKEDDGISQKWDKSAFVNPPYGAENEERWSSKALEEFNKYQKPIFILLPNKTEAPWFSKLFRESGIVLFPQKRINFVKNGKQVNGNIMGSVVFGLINMISDMGRTSEDWDKAYNLLWTSRDLGIPESPHDGYPWILFPDRDLLRKEYTFI